MPFCQRSRVVRSLPILLRSPSMDVLKETVSNPLPYYPLGVEIAGYVANSFTSQNLLSIFVVICVCIVNGVRMAVVDIHPNLSATDVATLLWFVLCEPLLPSMRLITNVGKGGCIHTFLEGM